MRKFALVLFFTLIGIVCFLVLYFYASISEFEKTAGSAQLKQYHNPALITPKADLIPPLVKEGLRMTSNCYGFTGECRFDNLNLFLRLEFTGWSGSFPSYQIFILWGGNSGWTFSKRYFGKRILSIEKNRISESGKSEKVLLGRFVQKIWNSSAYDDFSQILAFDLDKKKIFVSQNGAFMAVSQTAFEVSFD